MNKTPTKSKDMQRYHHVCSFIDNHGVWIVYLIAFLSLFLSALSEKKHWIMLIPIGVFILYDIWFRCLRPGSKDWKTHGRDYEKTIESVRMASQYTSFFIAIIAVSLSVLLDKDNPIVFIKVLNDTFLKAYGLLVLTLSGVVLLFIPIPYLSEKDNKEPSNALKNCFFCVLLMEKIIILLLVYLIIVLAKASLAVSTP